MFRGMNHIQEAVNILVARNTTLQQRLYEASKELAVAMRQRDHWPDNILQKARDIEKKVTARGRMGATLQGMDASEAGEVAKELAELASDVRVARALTTRTLVEKPHAIKGPRMVGRRARQDVS